MGKSKIPSFVSIVRLQSRAAYRIHTVAFHLRFTVFYGTERTSNILFKSMVLMTSVATMPALGEVAVRIIFRDITSTSDNTSYFAAKFYKHATIQCDGFS